MSASPGSASKKSDVAQHWEQTPCGTGSLKEREGTPAFFARLERERDALEPFIPEFARFERWRNCRVLEIGVGAATDFVRFARAGARLTGIDLTEHAVVLAGQRLQQEGLAADVRQADAEQLPFADGAFDFVYSWGVLHHTPDTAQAIREAVRVTRPGGELCVMLYNRHSLVALQAWIVYALLKGRPGRTLGEVIGAHVESPGTKAYTRREVAGLFAGLEDLRIAPVVTAYDLRLGRRFFLPRWFGRLLPRRLGWFLVITARRPESSAMAQAVACAR
jgi:SAM-dependent methyltransferase